MSAYISWFNKVRSGLMKDGVSINGVIHKASPVKKGNDWAKGECPKCGSKNGFVFRSHMDGKIYVLFCQRCEKYSWKHSEGKVEDSSAGRGRCSALTRSGNRCKNSAKDGMHLCGPHFDMLNEGKEVKLVDNKEVPASAF